MSQNYTSPPTKKQKNNCPYCGWETTRGFNFEQILAGTLPESVTGDFTAFRSTPSRTATIEADLLVPIGQTLATAIIITLPTFVVALWLKWEWYAPFSVGAVTLLAQWIRCLNLHEKTLAVVEEFSYSPTGQDLGQRSRDVGGDVVKLEVISGRNSYEAGMKIVDLPSDVSVEQFKDFCKDILSGKPLARRDWTGSGKQFSRDTYDDLMSAMLDAGLVFSLAGKGKRLTLGGKRAIARLVQND